jgi:hypothetical protein
MIMNFKKYSLYLLTAAVFLGGCKKQLDLSDPDIIAEENAFLLWNHVQQGANGAFGRYGAYANNMYVSALVSDEAKIGAGNAGQGALTFRYQYSSDGTTGGDVVAAFPAWYLLIDQVNRVLPHIYTVITPENLLPRREIVKGQLLALRALAHFELLQAYSPRYNPTEPLGVAIMLEADPLAQPARNTMGDVMAQIEQDLTDAKNLLPAVTPATFTDTVMNKVNIAAYQARIALYRGDYAAAITYSTEVINSGVKPLVTGSAFTGIWTDVNSNETLFRTRYLTSTAIGGLWTTTGGLIYIAPSDKLVASYGAGDIRLGAYVGNSSGNNYVNKFYTSARGGRVVDMKNCRIAEMYLIRAEAHAKKAAPDLTAGAADLNELRRNRITGYVDETFASATTLVNAVLDERFKELCFEGFRFFDLKRNNLPVQRNASDASPDWQTLPATSHRFVLPIPNAEMLANPNMKQNPGY